MRRIALLTLLTVASLGAAPVHNDEVGFTFTLPDGYRDFPAGRTSPGHVLYSYARGEPGKDFGLLRLDALPPVSEGPIDHAAFERGARQSARLSGNDFMSFEYGKTRWKSFELDVMSSHVRRKDDEMLIVSSVVPLAANAVQVMVTGSPDDKPRMLADLNAVLASLDGKSNWLTAEERSERLGFIVGLIVGLPLAIWLAVWWKRRRQRAR